MIIQIDTSKVTLPAGGEVTRSRWYAMRILRAGAGATIAWETPRDSIGAFAGSLYENPRGLKGLWVTGAVVLEYTDDPGEARLPPVSVSGSTLDVGNNVQVVGPLGLGAFVGISPQPVLVGGQDPVAGVAMLSLDDTTIGASNALVYTRGPDAENASYRQIPLVAGGVTPAALAKALSIDAIGRLASLANPTRASYKIGFFNSAPGATANFDIFVIESGSTKQVRLRRLIIFDVGNQTAAGRILVNVFRTITAGAAGVITPGVDDSADAAFSGVCRSASGGGAAGTLGVQVAALPLWVPAAQGPMQPIIVDFERKYSKGLTIPVGVANGITFRSQLGGAGWTNFFAVLEYTEE